MEETSVAASGRAWRSCCNIVSTHSIGVLSNGESIARSSETNCAIASALSRMKGFLVPFCSKKELSVVIVQPLSTTNISKKTQPRDHISEDVLRASYAATSGAQYRGVRAVGPDVVLPSPPAAARDKPKSVKRTVPPLTRMFCGLISLCRTPCSCKY